MLSVGKNSPLIQKKEQLPPINAVRATIRPDEHLTVTLRYFAAGETYHSPEYSLRISGFPRVSGLQLKTRLLRPLRPPFFSNFPGTRASLTANHQR